MRIHGLEPASCPEPAVEAGCVMRTPTTLAGSMVDVLRTYFGSTHRSTMEKASFLWNERKEVSFLSIEDEFNWNWDDVGSKPALIVALDDLIVGDGSRTIGRNGLSSYLPDSGGSRMSSRESGGFTIQCVARHKLESWSLAWEVKTFLQNYAYEIGRTYRFGSLNVAGIRKPAQVSHGGVDYMAAAVGVAFHLTSSFSVEREGLPATHMSLNVEAT
jgi:hypothetical protein